MHCYSIRGVGNHREEYAARLDSLAGLCHETGAETNTSPFTWSMDIQSEGPGKKHIDYAASLNNPAALFETTGVYDKAEHLYLESTAIRSEVLGKKHEGRS